MAGQKWRIADMRRSKDTTSSLAHIVVLWSYIAFYPFQEIQEIQNDLFQNFHVFNCECKKSLIDKEVSRPKVDDFRHAQHGSNTIFLKNGGK